MSPTAVFQLGYSLTIPSCKIKNAVSTYFTSKQILFFGFAEQNYSLLVSVLCFQSDYMQFAQFNIYAGIPDAAIVYN